MTKKSDLLGMPFGTACGRLRKSLIFHLAGKLGLLTCHRCGKEIETEREMSIEHKDAWEQEPDPVAAFFDLANIAFSHLRCNIGAALRPNRKWANQRDRSRDRFQTYYADPDKRARFLELKRARSRKTTT